MIEPLIEDRYPATPLQRGMLFHRAQGDNPGVDIEQMVARLHEPLDSEAMGRAWGVVTARHAALRTRFSWAEGGAASQEVVNAVATPFVTRDLRNRGRLDQQAALATYLAEDRARGFELNVAPLFRVALFQLAEDEHVLVWTYSHTLLDNAYAFVLGEVFDEYEALRRGEVRVVEPRPSYSLHCRWLDPHLETTRDAALAFFRAMLEGFETPTHAEVLRRAVIREDAGAAYGTHEFRLPGGVSDALRSLAVEDVSVSVVVEAAWALVLAAFDGTDDVVFGVTRNCRRTSVTGADRMVGLFINTVPVRVKVDPRQGLLAWLQGLRSQQRALRPFEHTALADVLGASSVPRGVPLFETLLVHNDRHIDARMKPAGIGGPQRTFELHDQTSFPLSLMSFDDPELLFRLEFDTRYHDEESVARLGTLLRAILEEMAVKGSVEERRRALLGELPRVPPGEEGRVLHDWQGAVIPAGWPGCIHEQIEAQVARGRDRPAVVFRDRRMTYGALDDRATRIADRLRGLGAGPGTLVGIYVNRSLEMVVGLLGILKAGAAYVPMDPSYPAERIAIMLEDTGAPVVLTVSALRGRLPTTTATLIAIDEDVSERPAAAAVPRPVTPDDLAYVIFTSGSTGRPKGTLVRHRNVTNFFAGMDAVLGTAPGVWLALTSISFDISVLELFWTLARGFLVVVQEEAARTLLGPPEAAPRGDARPVDFSLFFFAAHAGDRTAAPYRLLLEAAKYADAHDFSAIWTPERHFHPFGGLYPNPAITSAALAASTTRIALRAGSVVLPLHNAIRCAEDWSMVDNLSSGRVGLSFASGWHAADFVLAPDNFGDRRRIMAEGIETVRKLWRGEAVSGISGEGKAIEVRIYPPPVQREPPMWLTAGGSPETFALAGRLGANVLTNLLVMKAEELQKNIVVYRAARKAGGHLGEGTVSVMLHTFVGDDLAEVKRKIRAPFLEYLKTSTDLIGKMRWEMTAFAKPAGPSDARAPDLAELSEEDLAVIMDHAFERYVSTAGLFGTPESCLATVDRLRAMGVDEIACLIDFGVGDDQALAALPHLDALRTLADRGPGAAHGAEEDYGIAAQIRRYGVTHLQCTPSLATLITTDPAGQASLGQLQALLVGGEALPPALLDRLRTAVTGRIWNMYGPTETTIWSTVAEVTASDGPVAIGRPIANTRVYVVDRHLRPVPLGTPGELLIAGLGVAAGYLNRPSQTDERFVPDAFDAPAGPRAYRTGDLVRWGKNGLLEYLGRLDQQVKIRGHRVEVGEIEAALTRHPAVRDAVVTARSEGGETHLVAYVIPRIGGAPGGSGGAPDASKWRDLWDQTYATSLEGTDDTFNIAGWNSSYTGAPLPATEMRSWVEATTRRILALRPRRVLEIGCGTGLLLFRVAPEVDRYLGVDFAAAGLERIRTKLPSLNLASQVSLRELAADGLDAIDETFDTVVLNSVLQYFDDVDYLVRVIEKAFARLAPDGAMFIGDVRSLPLLSAFHTSVEVARAPAELPTDELRARVAQRSRQEGELVVDPAFFEALRGHLPISEVDIRLKEGADANELTQFRYDVVLRKGGSAAAVPRAMRVVEAPSPCALDSLRALVSDGPPAMRVVGVRNARVRTATLLRDGLATSTARTAQELREVVSAHAERGFEPSEAGAISPDYAAAITWSAAGDDRIDIVLSRPSREAPVGCGQLEEQAPRPGPRDWSSFANQPFHLAPTASMAGDLREYLQAKLPEYMIPTAFVVMDAFPLTPNGKVQRQALPAPFRDRNETKAAYVAPESGLEATIATVWQGLLGIERVGVEQNFFDLGANSLMMVQANVRLRDALGHEIMLVEMFRFPTVRGLARHLAGQGEGDRAQLKESHARAATRSDAMARRRELREGSRVKR